MYVLRSMSLTVNCHQKGLNTTYIRDVRSLKKDVSSKRTFDDMTHWFQTIRRVVSAEPRLSLSDYASTNLSHHKEAPRV